MNETTKHLTIRGLILEGMRYDPRGELSDVAIGKLLWGAIIRATAAEIHRDLEYLEGKAYIEIRKRSADLWIGKLTSKGTDLLEGRIEDDGVVLSR